MHKDRDSERVQAQELLIDRYVLAVDSGDIEAVGAALEAAYEASRDDPEIEHLITDINRAYQEEAGVVPLDADAGLVREIIRRCVPSAFETHDQLQRPLTVGDVASRLQAQGRVRPADEETNRALLGSSTLLPQPVTAPAVKNLAAELRAGGSDLYWRFFQDEAITMGISRGHDQAQLAARERRARRPQQRDKKKRD